MSDSENEGPTCIVCLCPAIHPVRLTCECKLTGCADCLFRWLNSKPQTVIRPNFTSGTCPTCRKVGVSPLLVDPDTGMTEPLTITEMSKRGDSVLVNIMVSLGANWFQTDAGGMTPLSAAAGAGQLTTVKMLMENFYAQSKDAVVSAFLCACENNHVDVAKYLIEKGANIHKGNGLWTPMSVAASNGHIGIVTLIGDIPHFDMDTSVDEEGTTPLHWAAMHGHLDVIRYLTDPEKLFFIHSKRAANSLRIGDILDKNNETPFHLALQHGHLDCVEFFLSTFPDTCGTGNITKDKSTTVLAAAEGGLYDVAMRLVNDFCVSAVQVNNDGCSAAGAAISNVGRATTPKDVDAIIRFLKFLVSSKGVSLQSLVNEDGDDLLHQGGVLQLTTCRYLVEEAGLSPWSVSNDSSTPLSVLLSSSRGVNSEAESTALLEVVMYLEEQCRLQSHPVQYDVPFSGDLYRNTYLHLAVRTESLAVVRYILDKLKQKGRCAEMIDALNDYHCTPLHSAVEQNCQAIVALLIKEGANPTALADDGQTCLHLVAQRMDAGALPMLRAFIEQYWGAGKGSLFKPDECGRTVLHEAISVTAGRRLKRNDLKEIGFKPRKEGDALPPSPEEAAERADAYSLEVVKYLLSHPDCTSGVLKLKDGYSKHTILHEAASVNDPACMRYLLKHLKTAAEKDGEQLGVAYFVADKDGNYPLHISAEFNLFFISKILLDAFPGSHMLKNRKGKVAADLADDDSVKALLA